MEKIELKKERCQAKIIGTVVTVAGAMLMTLYKGPLMRMAWTSHGQPHGGEDRQDDEDDRASVERRAGAAGWLVGGFRTM